ncbi:MAG: hypothetical protein U1E05_12870 [Patescibacteria group bacterium]|nr:hypothetical protein [Patescibacteria group bacterium]
MAAAAQQRNRNRLQSELAEVEPHYAQAVAQRAKLDALQIELRTARAEAALLTYLRHPWPRTQLLKALLSPLPDDVVLGRLEISTEGTRTPRAAPPLVQAGPEPAPSSIPPAELDLAGLRQRNDALETVMRLSGTTTDGAALHRYLGALARNALFRRVELEAIESPEGRTDGPPQFQATIVVTPGYGQPGGPTGPEPDAIVRQ